MIILKEKINYLVSLKRFILVSSLVFLFSVLYGFFVALYLPSEANLIIKEIQKMFASIIEASPFSQLFIIFLNNTVTAFLAVFLGLMIGIFPFLVIFSNGTILGILAYYSKINLSLFAFFALVLPHGIIEIPIIIISCAMGFKLGSVFAREVRNYFKKNKNESIPWLDLKKETANAFSFFTIIVIPLLFLAAVVEVFITGSLVSFF